MMLLNDAQVFGEDKIIENDEVLTCGGEKGWKLKAKSRVCVANVERFFCIYFLLSFLPVTGPI